MNYLLRYCDLNNGLKFRYSGHGLSNGVVKVRNLNGSVIRRVILWILTVHFFSETLRTNDRNLRKVTRDVERDRRELERDEKKLELEIKKAAKAGNKQVCTVLAKQLIQLRKQKARTYQVNLQALQWGSDYGL